LGRQVRDGGSRINRGALVKIAVTGASGFIGRYVLKELMRRPCDVVAVTRMPEKLADFDGSVEIKQMDVSQGNPGRFEYMGQPEILIHLAWDGLPNYKSHFHFEKELPVQYQFLKGLIEEGLPALLVTGTCFEYGMRSGPLSEKMDARPENPYGYAKDCLRRQLQFLQSSTSFDLTWSRLFYMYGDGQSGGTLFSQLREAVSRGDRAFNMSGGEQLRDYLPVEEVARLIVELALRRDNTVVNICSGEPISVRSLVEKLIRQNGWDIDLNLGHHPYPDYEPFAFWGDAERLNGFARKI
jgi:dTDP-6-deoxy-L-talose 4-dehydrogenase (NAD+)